MGAVTLGGLESKGGGGPGAHQQIAPLQTQQKAADLAVPESPAVRRQSATGISAHLQAADQPRVTEGHQRIAARLRVGQASLLKRDVRAGTLAYAREIPESIVQDRMAGQTIVITSLLVAKVSLNTGARPRPGGPKGLTIVKIASEETQ